MCELGALKLASFEIIRFPFSVIRISFIIRFYLIMYSVGSDIDHSFAEPH